MKRTCERALNVIWEGGSSSNRPPAPKGERASARCALEAPPPHLSRGSTPAGEGGRTGRTGGRTHMSDILSIAFGRKIRLRRPQARKRLFATGQRVRTRACSRSDWTGTTSRPHGSTQTKASLGAARGVGGGGAPRRAQAVAQSGEGRLFSSPRSRLGRAGTAVADTFQKRVQNGPNGTERKQNGRRRVWRSKKNPFSFVIIRPGE